MILTLEQWRQILNAVGPNNLSESDIFEQIKAKLKEQHQNIYEKWEQRKFDETYLFNICVTIDSTTIDTTGTLLHIAALNGHLEIVKYFINKKGVNINQSNRYGNTALHFAARNGHLEIVKYLAENEKTNINAQNSYYNTALHCAAENNYLEIVKYFVNEKGVDINQSNGYGKTVLHFATKNGHLEIVKYLAENEKTNINAQDSYGEAALHFAAENNYLEIVKYFVNEKGADINPSNKEGDTALHFAARNGHEEIVDALLKAERIDVNKHNKDGNTSLHIAAENGYVGIIKALLNKKADPSLKNKKDKTPRDLATDENVIHLLKKDAKQATLQAEVSSILNEPDNKPCAYEANIPHSTKGNKLPIITTSAGLLLGLSIAYLAGAATLTPVGAVVAVFLAAAVVGALVGYGVGKVSQKLFVESINKHPKQELGV